MPLIRPETPADHPAVHRLLTRAFGQPDEALLVDRLRPVADPSVSLVAEEAGAIVGHIFFSPVEVDAGDAVFTALGLAPMAVLPERQRLGIGAALVREGLAACRALGYGSVFVLGHPAYYPRFGFRPAGPFGLSCEYDVPEEVFMVAELTPGALTGLRGVVRYRPEFGRVT